jgi:cell division protein FtsQ
MEVHADASMSLYLRLCDFEVAFGQIENIEDKMAALRSFYEDALPKLGWDRYEKIRLEFNNQIVCTKKK